MSGRGVDLAFGRTLPRLVREAGLVDVRAEALLPLASPTLGRLEVLTVEQLRDQLLASGLVDAAAVDEHVANVRAGRVDVGTAPLVTVVGRRPAG
jgi:hypothetical protein